MNHRRNGCSGLIAISLVSAFFFMVFVPGAARADVTVERFIKSGGFGGVGASEGTSTDRISGLKKRSASTMQMTGKIGGLLGKFGGDMGTDEIILVEEDRVVTMNHKKKTYTERTITLPQGEEDTDYQAGTGTEDSSGYEEEEKRNVRVVRNEVTVTQTGEKKPIGAFECERYMVTWIVETEDLDTKERATSTMITDLWNTPETKQTRALQEEENAFNQAYLEKVGIDIPPQKMKRFGLMAVAGMLGADHDEMEEKMKELEKKFSTIEGFSIASSVTWKTSSTAQQEQQGEEAEEIDMSEGFGGLLSGFAKKVAKKSAEKKEDSGEGTVIFSSYTEIRQIDTSTVPNTEFLVPEGYARK